MHEQSKEKEVDGLRRLADLLRQAVTAATEVVPTAKKQQALRIKKLQRGDTASAPSAKEESSGDAHKPRWGQS